MCYVLRFYEDKLFEMKKIDNANCDILYYLLTQLHNYCLADL